VSHEDARETPAGADVPASLSEVLREHGRGQEYTTTTTVSHGFSRDESGKATAIALIAVTEAIRGETVVVQCATQAHADRQLAKLRGFVGAMETATWTEDWRVEFATGGSVAVQVSGASHG